MAGINHVIAAHQHFENRATLAAALAERVARGLSRAISRQGFATLAVSGGTTPQLFFEHLSGLDISWEKVVVTLVDERQVEEANPRSNARLVKAALLQNKARVARFVALYRNEAKAAQLQLDVVVLGMGEDGHTASFFPGGDRLVQALDLKSKEWLVAISAPGAGEPRLTFTLKAILQAKVLCLHIEGAKKQLILDKAMAGTDIFDMPVRAVLQAGNPLEIFCCP